MNRRLSIALALGIMAPIALMGWLGLRSVRLEQEQWQARLAVAAQQVLGQHDETLSRLMDRVQQDIRRQSVEQAIRTVAGQRRMVRNHRFVRQPFVLNPEGTLLLPDPAAPTLSNRERAFLRRTANLRDTGGILARPPTAEAETQPPDAGWRTWFWEDGVQFLYWWRTATDDALLGVEINRYALLAEIIAALPPSGTDTSRAASRYASAPAAAHHILLQDARGNKLYGWGHYTPVTNQVPLATRPLAPPLGAWQLAYYAPPLAANGIPPAAIGLLLSLFGVILMMITAASIMVREHGRAVREARQRVSFVNQVSHELKTPLTNIRMYTELLQKRLSGTDTKTDHYLHILVSECRRLGRMIHNVLSFGQHGRGALRLRLSNQSLDAVVQEVIGNFQPLFQRKHMQISFRGQCPEPLTFDPDALEQILGNLLSNAEKYAGEQTVVELSTRREQDIVILRVCDTGSGIPARHRDDIFKPFFRIDNRLTQKAGGAGIGLSISRELARLHGGDLTLEAVPTGTCFRLTLPVQNTKTDSKARKA